MQPLTDFTINRATNVTLEHYFRRNLHGTKSQQRCTCLKCRAYQETWRLRYVSLAMAEGLSSKALFPPKKRVKSAVREHFGDTKNDQGVIQDDESKPDEKKLRLKAQTHLS